MNLTLFALLALSSPTGDPPATCTLSGTLSVKKEGSERRFTPEYAEVYVDTPLLVAPRRQEHVMLQKGLAFVPRVLVVEKGDVVVFKNEDKTPHEIHADKEKNTFVSGENLKPETFQKSFQLVGTSLLGCNKHPIMSGVILTVPNSFHAKVDQNGKWSISGLPRQQLTLVFWENTGMSRELKRVTVTACDTASIDTTIVLKEQPNDDFIPGAGPFGYAAGD